MHPEAQVLAAVIRWTLTAFAILFAWQCILLPSLTENFRQHVFKLRRELFLYMADGHVAPDEPAYGFVRASMNAVLRTAERYTLSRLVIAAWVQARYAADLRSIGDELVSRVADEEVRRKLDEFRGRLVLLVIWHACITSPFAFPLVLAAMIRAAVRSKPRQANELPKVTNAQVVEADARVALDDDERWWSIPPGMPQATPSHAAL